MKPLSFDVVIIGARVAGSVLAARLGDGGMRVLLVDKVKFPSPTISTHFFRGRATLDVLSRLGVLSEIMAFGSPPLTYFYSYQKNASHPDPIINDEDFGSVGHNLSVRRDVFDEVLVRRASRGENVTLMENTVATALIWQDGQVCGVRLQARGGEIEVRCRLLVGADGRNSHVAKWVHAADETREPGHRGIFYCYVHGFQGPLGRLDGMEFSQWGDEAAYVFPSNHQLTCLALSLNLEKYAWMRKDVQTHFWQRLHEYACFDGRLDRLEMEGKMLGCGPQPNFMRVPCGPGWALAGDAGMHLDPWSGLGMDNASSQAFFLANTLLEWHAGRSSLQDATAEYHRFRNESSHKGYQETVGLSKNLNYMDPDYAAEHG